MGMVGTRLWRGHEYVGDKDMEGTCVWSRQGYGGDKDMEGDGYVSKRCVSKTKGTLTYIVCTKVDIHVHRTKQSL